MSTVIVSSLLLQKLSQYKKGTTALLLAVKQGRADLVKALIDAGADGRAALSYAQDKLPRTSEDSDQKEPLEKIIKILERTN